MVGFIDCLLILLVGIVFVVILIFCGGCRDYFVVVGLVYYGVS